MSKLSREVDFVCACGGEEEGEVASLKAEFAWYDLLKSLFSAKILSTCCLDLSDGWTMFHEEAHWEKTVSNYLTIFRRHIPNFGILILNGCFTVKFDRKCL